MTRTRYLLLGSPRELQERDKLQQGNRLDFLLINVGGACNHKCFFCWTHNNTYPIQNASFLNEQELTVLVESFHDQGGHTIAIMSDGEPLFSINFAVTKHVVKLTGEFSLNMLLFSNGQLLSKGMINELTQLNHRISFVVSVNASTEKLYDRIHGTTGAYRKVMANREAWKEFCQKKNRQVENITVTQFAIHFVATKTSVADIPKMQELANDIDCALIVASPGMSGRALLNEGEIARNQNDLEFLEHITKQYSDTEGPTAKTYEGECAYISHSRNINSSHGVTIHSLGGMVQVCPYFVGLGSEQWFSLKKYLGNGGNDVTGWLSASVQIAKLITDALFAKFGYYYCLKRHPKYHDFEKFIIEVNRQMKERTIHLHPPSHNYFEELIKNLQFALETPLKN